MGQRGSAKTEEARQRQLANLRPFVKGQSGNPLGPHANKDWQETARLAKEASPQGMMMLIERVFSVDPETGKPNGFVQDRDWLGAMAMVFDRGLGRPKETLPDVDIATSETIDNLSRLLEEFIKGRPSQTVTVIDQASDKE